MKHRPLIPIVSALVVLLVLLLFGLPRRRAAPALPEVAATLDLPDRHGLRLKLTAGALRLGNEKVATLVDYRMAPEAAPLLAAALQKALAGKAPAEKHVLIYGDRHMPFAALSALVKQLTTNGISRISLAVSRESL